MHSFENAFASGERVFWNSDGNWELRCAACHEAILAEYRPSAFLDGARLERNLAGVSALGAYGVVHFTITRPLLLAGCPTSLAALGGAQVLGGIKFLFTCRELERRTAIAAHNLLIISHKRERKRNKWASSPSSEFLSDRLRGAQRTRGLVEGICAV